VLALKTAAVQLAAGYLQRGEQARGSVPGIVMAHAGRQPWANIGSAGWVRLIA